MEFICGSIPNLFGCYEIGHVIWFKIPANAYCMLCQFLCLTLSFSKWNEMMGAKWGLICNAIFVWKWTRHREVVDPETGTHWIWWTEMHSHGLARQASNRSPDDRCTARIRVFTKNEQVNWCWKLASRTGPCIWRCFDLHTQTSTALFIAYVAHH